MIELTKEIWTVPQKQVAVAVLLSLPPVAPSEGRGMFPLMLDSAEMILSREQSQRSAIWMAGLNVRLVKANGFVCERDSCCRKVELVRESDGINNEGDLDSL